VWASQLPLKILPASSWLPVFLPILGCISPVAGLEPRGNLPQAVVYAPALQSLPSSKIICFSLQLSGLHRSPMERVFKPQVAGPFFDFRVWLAPVYRCTLVSLLIFSFVNLLFVIGVSAMAFCNEQKGITSFLLLSCTLQKFILQAQLEWQVFILPLWNYLCLEVLWLPPPAALRYPCQVQILKQ
jgi:hypothetical protein